MSTGWRTVWGVSSFALAVTFGLASAAVTEPIVFVSRQIPDQGSVFFPEARALPGVGPHGRFRPSSPGKLFVREVNGSMRVLVDGSAPNATNLNLIDVNSPSVSYDGRRIVFSGLPASSVGRSYPTNPGEVVGAWRLYVINADGTGLQRVPIPEQTVPLNYFIPGASGIWRYDDTYPCWLPDGRIVFSSTRWLTYGQYSGMVGSNLFVVNADGGHLHRITSERSGADRPLVDPLTGRIVFARWWRNYRFPTALLDTVRTTDGYARHLGLTTQFDPAPPANVGQFDANFWAAASINPDGTDLKAFSLFFRGNEQMNHFYGGTFAPDGTLFGNYYPMENMTEAAGFGGIRKVLRGAQRYQHIIGNTRRYERPQLTATSFGVEQSPSGYATDPAVMADGTLLVSLAVADLNAATGADIGQDYGLYLIDPATPGKPILLHDRRGTAELQTQVLAPRPAPPIIPDSVVRVAGELPPGATGPYDSGGVFTFHALNVYANGPVDMDIVNAPPVGSAAKIRFFLDHQRSSFGSFPAHDWPILLHEMAVNPDGSVRHERAPADLPLFEQLRSADGGIPPTHRGINADGGAHVAGMNYARPGTTQRCMGCHAGHTLLPVPVSDEAARWTNLAPGAAVTASSRRFADAPRHLVDRRVHKANFHWESSPGALTGQWLRLEFPVDVFVRAVRLYGAGACPVPGSTVHLYRDPGATVLVATQSSGALAAAGTDVQFADAKARVVKVALDSPVSGCSAQSSVSVSEIEVIAAAGPAGPGADGDSTPPSVPMALSATLTLLGNVKLLWRVSTDDTGVKGYRVYRDGVPLGFTTVNSLVDRVGISGKTHRYRVAALDLAGNTSMLSTEVSIVKP